MISHPTSAGLPEHHEPWAHEQSHVQRNVGEREQILTLLAGAGLTLYGIKHGSWLGMISFLTGASLLNRGWTGYCVTYDLLGINTTAGYHPRPGVRARHGRKIERTFHINRSRQDVYDYWRNIRNLPNVMRHLQSVTPIDAARSRWVAHAPFGQTLQWEAEIITDRPGEVIAWQSMPGSQVDSAGSIHLSDSPQGEGTDVTVSLKYDPPGGQAVAGLAHLLGQGLEQELDEDFRRLKQVLESDRTASGTVTATGSVTHEGH